MATSIPRDRSKRSTSSRKRISRDTLRLLAAFVQGKLDAREQDAVRRFLLNSPKAQKIVSKLYKKLGKRPKKKRSRVKTLLTRVCRIAAMFLLVAGAGAAWHFFSSGGDRQLAALFQDWTQAAPDSEEKAHEPPAHKIASADLPVEKPQAPTMASEKKGDSTAKHAAKGPAEKRTKPIEKISADEKHAEKTADRKSTVKEKPVEKTSTDKVAAKEKPVEKTSTDKVAAKEKPVEKPAKVAKKARTTEAIENEKPAEKVPATKVARTEKAGDETATAEKKPAEKKATEQVAMKDREKPAEDTVVKEMSAEKLAVKEKPPQRNVDLETYEAKVQPVLKEYCLSCHTGKKAKSGFRLDNLRPNFESPANAGNWAKIQERLADKTMPPKRSPHPKKSEVAAINDWIGTETKAAASVRQAEGRVLMRRLNRIEYERTIRDVLGISGDYQKYLPEDPVEDGFDNVAAALRLSTLHLNCYLEAADAALTEFFAYQQPLTKAASNRYDYREYVKKKTKDRRDLLRDDGVVFFVGEAETADWSPRLPGFNAPATGTYKVRISAYAYQSETPVVFLLSSAPTNKILGWFEVPPGAASVVEAEVQLAKGNALWVIPHRFHFPVNGKTVKPEDYKGRGLGVQWVEVEGPSEWPSAAYHEMLGKVDLKKVTPSQVVPIARRVLRVLATRAYRRPIKDVEITPYVQLVRASYKPGGFENALRIGMQAVLCSPDFLFLTEESGKLSDDAVACRLSYFLWKSPPDAELRSLAARGELTKPEVLHEQLERMLASPKASAFTENFLGQWLELRKIDATSPDPHQYPHFDPLLRTSMIKETHEFFQELLKNDLSVLNFVDSDFVMVNKPLADFYNIKGVEGVNIQKVPVPKGSHRGGIMTQASILKITANGTETSPVTRGAWVLKNLLGKPPEPPPPDVPALEPDVRGAKTVRARLAKHRADPSCASCHRKIDPVGFALENFDPIGGWRDYYRGHDNSVKERIEVTTPEGKVVKFLRGPRISSQDRYDGKAFRTVDEFKKILMNDPDQVARCLIEKLTTYSTGAPIGPGEKPAVEELVEQVRKQNYGLRSMVHALVQSKLFLNK